MILSLNFPHHLFSSQCLEFLQIKPQNELFKEMKNYMEYGTLEVRVGYKINRYFFSGICIIF